MQAVLSSWKDIANYVGKGVRTAQRWEVEFALPVRRFTNAKDKQSVFAIPAEIDAWILLRTPKRRSQEPDELAALRRENEDLRARLAQLEAIQKTQIAGDVLDVTEAAPPVRVDGSAPPTEGAPTLLPSS